MRDKFVIYFLFVIGLFTNLSLKSQDHLKPNELFIYYEDEKYRIVAEPTYTFHQNHKDIHKIHITDSAFLMYIDSVILNIKPQSMCNNPSVIWPGMIQIVYRKSNCKYYTINMSYFIIDELCYRSVGFLELDGQTMEYNPTFQDVINQIVNCHIYNSKIKINAIFLRGILEGKRYKNDIYPKLYNQETKK